MNTLDALLNGIVADPGEETRWLVIADWLEEHDDPRRGELLRLHRQLLASCCEPDTHPERAVWQSRIVTLIGEGVQPCVPQKTFTLQANVPMTFAFIPPGRFRMGSGNFHESPAHTVTLTRGFFLGVHPVTQAQWTAVMSTNPSSFKGSNRPVEQVSWDDCQEFCQKATASQDGRFRVRVPTEAEWEYACRAGTTTNYHVGDVINPDLANYDGSISWNGSPKGKYRRETTDIGSFPMNPWSLFDMHGNVWDWCQDVWEQNFYQRSPASDPVCADYESSRYVFRGGSWNNGPYICRSTDRGFGGRGLRNDVIGCRVCFHPH